MSAGQCETAVSCTLAGGPSCFRPDLTALGFGDLDADDKVTTDNPVAPHERGFSVNAESDEARVGINPQGQTVARSSGTPLISINQIEEGFLRSYCVTWLSPSLQRCRRDVLSTLFDRVGQANSTRNGP
jgi:hypothetical protein